MRRPLLARRVIQTFCIFFLFSSVLSSAPRRFSHNQPLHSNVRGSHTRERPAHPQQQPFNQFDYSNYGDMDDQNTGHLSLPPGPSSSLNLGQCRIVKVHAGSIPKGQTNETINLLFASSNGISSVKECSIACCEVGPELCHYAWVFDGKCVAVSCTEDDIADNCLPQTMELNTPSIYIQMTFSPATPNHDFPTDPSPNAGTSEGQGVGVEDLSSTVSPPTTTEPPHLHSDTVTGHTHDIPTFHTTSLLSSTSTSSPSSSPSSSSSTAPRRLTLSFAGETELTLPQDSTRIFSSTWPAPGPHQMFHYRWKKVEGPDQGALQDINKKDLHLSGLVAGVYVLKLTVLNFLGEKSGEGTVNVTVHPPVRENTPPIPVIKPTQHVVIVLPKSSCVLDASGSYDDQDSKALRYHWEEEAGPMDSSLSSDLPLLSLKNLKEGDYRFKLTVTDREGLSAEDYATVTVSPHPYYPPQALAGKDYIIKLPNSQVTLDGSRSTAYEGPLQYSWVLLDGPGPVDLKGTSEAVLHVMDITFTGDYLFRLRVTDSRGKSSSANVSVVVLPENNLPPVANAGPDRKVQFPSTSTLLNGSASSDDFKISSWDWTLISGPHDIELTGADMPVLHVDKLHVDESVGSPSLYQFQLCVVDYHNLTDIANVTIAYYKSPLVPPHVFAGPDLPLVLPQDTAILNGSSSHDDFGIVSYQWQRSEESPAAGLVVGSSDRSPVLVVSGLVEGSYNFTLTVLNKNNMSASDTTTVSVSPHPMILYMLELVLQQDEGTNTFSLSDKRQLQRVLGLILTDIAVDYDVVIQDVYPVGPDLQVDFYAVRRDNHAPLNASLAYQKLTEHGQDFRYPESDFHFIKIDMKVCQLPCSGHGSCDQKTHKCRCSRYWMENPFKANFGKQETNCEWSIFYVSLGVVLGVALLLFLVWLACWCCIRRHKLVRSKRRVRYAILGRKELEEGQEMLPHSVLGGYRQANLMLTESDTDDEEQLLFESKNCKDGGSSIGNGTMAADASPVQVRTNHRSRSSSSTRGEGSTPT